MKPLSQLARSKTVVVVFATLALTALAFVARAVTTVLVEDRSLLEATETTHPTPAIVDTEKAASSSTTSGVVDATTSTRASVVDATEGGGAVTADGVTFTVGEPTIEPIEPVSFIDRVTVLAGVISDLPMTSGQAPGAGSTSGQESGSGGAVASSNAASQEQAPTAHEFTLGMTAEPNGHHATISLLKGSLLNGLADLTVDFGDGSTVAIAQGDLARIGRFGSIRVEHRYEPTLTPQPQRATAVATDQNGKNAQASVTFDTQAEFALAYSPITVTALGDCDLFGKGDFEMTWNNDGRDHTANFDLGKGESFVENRFRVGIDGLHFGEESPVELMVRENDSIAVELLRFSIFDRSGLDRFYDELFVNVVQIGAHTIPVMIESDARSGCRIRIEYDLTVAMPEPPR